VTLAQQMGAVFVVVYTLLQLSTFGMIVRDFWTQRWSQRFRNTKDFDTGNLPETQYAKDDLRAFIKEARVRSKRIDLVSVFTYPLAASIGVSIVWALLTVISQYMVGL